MHTFIQLASAFFIGYFAKRTSEGIFRDGLVFLPIFLIWIAVAISATHPIGGAGIVGLLGAASVLAPILYIATIAGIYSNRDSRVLRKV